MKRRVIIGALAMFLLRVDVATAAGPPLTYVVLGDSTAAGVGGTYELGIAIATERSLAARHTVTMTNLAVSGARMSHVRRRQLPVAASLRPDLVLLSAGANDVTHLTPLPRMRADLRAIVQALTAANPNVRIVVTGAPDMGSPPRIPRILRGIAAWRTVQANRMFRAEAASQGLIFAPIADVTGPLFRHDPSLFAADRFHPNDRGYATWIPVLNEALATALSSNSDLGMRAD
ncbi:MAG TPA: SGNH/GDSL hydrolase family protein [Thermoanaerobaculia bacterium]|nr:SGNH/GDSL hydrolase family protein [Thermoanaerobaculia bacterium]